MSENKKGAGRPNGSVNKTTFTMREIIADKLYDRIPGVFKDIDNMPNAIDRVKAISLLLPYVLPRQKAVILADETSNTLSDRLSGLLEKEVLIDESEEEE